MIRMSSGVMYQSVHACFLKCPVTLSLLTTKLYSLYRRLIFLFRLQAFSSRQVTSCHVTQVSCPYLVVLVLVLSPSLSPSPAVTSFVSLTASCPASWCTGWASTNWTRHGPTGRRTPGWTTSTWRGCALWNLISTSSVCQTIDEVALKIPYWVQNWRVGPVINKKINANGV